jgi:hypothetical protein
MQLIATIIFFYFFSIASVALTVWLIIVCWRFFRDAARKRRQS